MPRPEILCIEDDVRPPKEDRAVSRSSAALATRARTAGTAPAAPTVHLLGLLGGGSILLIIGVIDASGPRPGG